MKADRFARFTWLVLAFNIAVILWGAYVRITGSGAGCGSHWPLCNGEIVPMDPSVETMIEFSHRLTSGVALLLVIAMVVWAFRRYPKGHRVRLAATLSLILIFVEAAIGAGLVLFELVAENESMARAMFMSCHLANTFLMLGAMGMTCFWAMGGPSVRWSREMWPYALGLGGLMLAGMSGAVAALGDTLFPSTSLAQALADDFSPSSKLLIRLRKYHPLIAILSGVYLLWLSRQAVGQERHGRRFAMANAVLWLVLVQLGLGTLNVALLAPMWLQIIHLLVADALWLAVLFLGAMVFAVPEESPAKP